MYYSLPRTHGIRLVAGAFVIGISLFLFLPVLAQAQERVVSYETIATIQSDSSVDIIERIAYDFGSNIKRGIYRDIDTVKRVGSQRYRLEVSDVSVTNQVGELYEVEILNRREDLRLNIGGDVPRWTGVIVFEIAYTVDGILLFNETNNALLLDAIGFDWGVPILDSQAQIILPTAVEPNELQFECFVGQPGSTSVCNNTELVTLASSTATGSAAVRQLTFTHADNLGNGAGMSIGVTFPKGFVTETAATKIESIPNTFLFILTLTLLPLLAALKHFYYRSKNKLQIPIVRQYDIPDEIAIFEAGLILKHSYQINHTVAQVISLAQRGYLKIVHYEHGWFFFKKSEYLYVQLRPGDDLPEFERTLLAALTAPQFLITREAALEAVKADETIPASITADIEAAVAITHVSKLQNKFTDSQRRISTLAQTLAVQNGLYTDDFASARGKAGAQLFKYMLVFAGLIASIFISLQLFYSERSFETVSLVMVAVAIAAVIILVITGSLIYRLPNLSQKGITAKEHLLGLKQYMEQAETERMEYHFDPEKNPELFEKLLPYAVLLGMEKRWIKHLEHLDHQPDWYHSSSGQAFSSNSFNGVVSSMSTATSSSSSTGVGSAGGGSGGGGGGSR